MTSKTMKTILFASLLVAMILPFSSMDFAEAQKFDAKQLLKKVEQLDKTAIEKKNQIDKVKEDRKNNKITKEKADKNTEQLTKEISQLEDEFNVVQKSLKDAFRIDSTKYEQMQEALVNINESMPSDLPFVSVGIYHDSKSIVLTLDKNIATKADIKSAERYLKNIVPSNLKTNVELGESFDLTACSSRFSPCSPLEGGVEVWAEGQPSAGDCSLGFKAKRYGVVGFVFAGHCADGSLYKNVHQNDSGPTVGQVKKETFNVSNTYCDCAFVATTTGITNKAYGASGSTTAQVTASNAWGDFVKKSGIGSGFSYGYVLATGVTHTTSSGTVMHNQVITDLYALPGDSGSPILGVFSNDIYGVMSTSNTGVGFSSYAPVDQIASYIQSVPDFTP